MGYIKRKTESLNSSSLTQNVGSGAVQAESGPSGPIYFNSNGHSLFGWFQGPPAHAMADVGLVICKPFGYEAICAHRSLRAFADAAVALGLPTLRVDYLGSGDSAPIESNADQLEVWKRDVIAAVSELRRRTGVRHICFLGVRLGALIAALAAAECEVPATFIFIAPVVNGRRYLRDLRMTRLAALMGRDEAGPKTGSGSLEVSGFTLSAATVVSLMQVDLTTWDPRPTSAVLVLDGKSMPGPAAFTQHLASLGIDTTHAALPGLVEMIMTAPQYAAVPSEMVAASQTWLRKLVASLPAHSNARYLHSHSPGSEFMTLRGDGRTHPHPLTERPLFFGRDSAIFGVLTEPRPGEVRRRAVIMLNAGADIHVGVNGMHVTLARQWSSRGYVVLRMDLAGLGDSRTHPGQPDNEVFPSAALEDVRDAIQLLRDRYAVTDVTLFGVCSGAYHALRAAAAGFSVNRILMVNPLNYFWKAGTKLDDLQVVDVVRNPMLYRQRLLSREAWKRLFAGKVGILRIARVYMTRPLLSAASALRDAARWSGLRLRHDLGRELEEISARGVKIVFVFARNEPGFPLLQIEAGSALRRLGDRCRVRFIDDADHVFSESGPRAALQDILSNELFARPMASVPVNATERS
jgi:dienelactone hydrolase